MVSEDIYSASMEYGRQCLAYNAWHPAATSHLRTGSSQDLYNTVLIYQNENSPQQLRTYQEGPEEKKKGKKQK